MERQGRVIAPSCLFVLEVRRPLLVARFAQRQRILSWALVHPGFRCADRVAWLEVREADLTVEVDPAALLRARFAAEGLDAAIGMMTSRNVAQVRRAAVAVGDAQAECAATVGLGNAVRVAEPGDGIATSRGTINLLAAVSQPLSDTAMIEAVSVATEARTAAVIDARLRLPAGLATGTGTDCLAVAAPEGPDPAPFCGLHTALGQALGAAVYDATLAGARDWIAEMAR